MPLIYPTPVNECLNYSERENNNPVFVSVSGFEAETATKRFELRNIKVSENPDYNIIIIHSDEISSQGYELRFENNSPVPKCEISVSGRRGLLYAVNAVSRLILKYSDISGSVTDYPSFSERGIIEGFYGKPWSRQSRLDMLTFISMNNMNVYFYGPKDDAYHRDLWDEPYDEASYANLKEIVEHCRENEIDFVYCIAPGITMEYSNSEHIQKLKNKLSSVHALGVNKFSLLLDDIPGELQYKNDICKFGNLVNAHIEITNIFAEICKAFDKNVKLAVCPYLYCGTGAEEYIRSFGRGISPDIRILWTGRDICSREILSRQAEEFRRETGHNPYYWDNYPVNDANMYNEMHIGAVRDRDKDLYKYSDGLIANGMEYPEASKAGYMTIADYLWNSESYNPDESHIKAMKYLIGEENYDVFRFFSDNLQTCCLRNSNSELMSEYLQQVRFSLKINDFENAKKTFEEYCFNMNSCREFVNGGMNNAVLFIELSPWIEKFNLLCDILNFSFEYLKSKGELNKSVILDMLTEYKSDPIILADFCFFEIIEFLLDFDFNK